MSEAGSLSKKERFKHEMIKYAYISAYLYLCFAVVALYKATILEDQGIEWVPFGFAIVQALVLGKFVLIGHALSVGERPDDHPLLHRVMGKSFALVALLAVFKVIEEFLVGWYHGHSFHQTVEEFLHNPLWVYLAPVLLMLLILIPLVTASEVIRTVGVDRFRAMLLERRSEEPE